MYADRKTRLISYHDTWISIDPIQGCPYKCVYCVLRHANRSGIQPRILLSPGECVQQLLNFPLFIPGYTPVAIGNETDMLHPLNQDYLVDLLWALRSANISNPISLITKAPLTDKIMNRIRSVEGLRLVFFLSYSGLGQSFEPNFTDHKLRENFQRVKMHDFPLVHYWRPLMPDNTKPAQIRKMLSFVSPVADASVITGLKLHPELSEILASDERMSIPDRLMSSHGEWIEAGIIERIYKQATLICPDYPLYRHTSCALASVLSRPNHTATIFRKDVCLPSHCSPTQRTICESAKAIPDDTKIAEVLSRLEKDLRFTRFTDRVVINDVISQEEFSYLLHTLNCPLEAAAIRFENLYRGDIFANQEAA
jgi:hypothetical protein